MTSASRSTPRRQDPPTTSDLAAITRRVAALTASVDRRLVVAISGFGGAGKSTLAEALHALMPGSQVVSGDEFLTGRPPTARSDDWATVDRMRLLAQVLLPIRRGSASRFQVYDSDAGTIGPWVTVTGSPVIVEGLGLFHPDIVGHFDLRVWIDVDLDTRTGRLTSAMRPPSAGVRRRKPSPNRGRRVCGGPAGALPRGDLVSIARSVVT